MSQTAKAQEPSMEEILASIRRIIADDESKAKQPEPPKPVIAAVPPQPAPAPAPVAPPQSAAQDEIDAVLSGLDTGAIPADDGVPDVLELTESMAEPAQQPPVFQTIEGQGDVFFAEAPPEPPAPPPFTPPPMVERPSAPPPETPALMSAATSMAVDAAFSSLAHTVLTQNARTLEDLVKDMMRPMLKAWLDDNLPGMVERVVRAEIERVSRGR